MAEVPPGPPEPPDGSGCDCDCEEEPYRRSLHCDLVSVEVEGPDPDIVAEMFEETVAEAFERYDEHVDADNGRTYHE